MLFLPSVQRGRSPAQGEESVSAGGGASSRTRVRRLICIMHSASCDVRALCSYKRLWRKIAAVPQPPERQSVLLIDPQPSVPPERHSVLLNDPQPSVPPALNDPQPSRTTLSPLADRRSTDLALRLTLCSS